jgi:TonB-dependent receptor
MVSNFYNTMKDTLYDPVPQYHVKYDYFGHEEVLAFYIMPEIRYGDYITFIPGLRVEKTYQRYSGFRGDEIPVEDDEVTENVFYDTITQGYSYNDWLPQIHLKIKPATWIDLRLAYTRTLSRPDYNDLAPRQQVNTTDQSVIYSTTHLKPVRSENYDLILSFYTPKAGLYTVGFFYKNISNFIYSRNAILMPGTSMDPSHFGFVSNYAGYEITYPVNNPEVAVIKGFEIEAQTNMNFLPSPFNGIVIGGNFTLMDSKAKYNETLKFTTANPLYPGPGQAPVVTYNYDTSYVDRLLLQAKYQANLSIGYDLKGFSARLSFTYTDEILQQEQKRPDGADREYTIAFYKWDFQLKQKLGKHLSLFGNISNLFNQPDQSVRAISGYYTRIEYYGMSANLGLKFNFF